MAENEPIVIPEQPMATKVDEMGAADPVFDISLNIEYDYYKCDTCGKKVFAGAHDTHAEIECANPSCDGGGVEVKVANTSEKRMRHGTMKRYHYSAKRPAGAHASL